MSGTALATAAALTLELLDAEIADANWGTIPGYDNDAYNRRVRGALTTAAAACDVDIDELWAHLAQHSHPVAPALVATCGPPHLLAGLADSQSLRVQLGVTCNAATTSRILALLAEPHDPLLDVLIVEHPNTDADTLEGIVAYTHGARDSEIRDAARAHPNWRHTIAAAY